MRMFDEFAAWWPVLSTPSDYEEEADIYRRLLVEAHGGVPRTLLELGSGGGNNASHIKAHFEEVVLVDRSRGMLDVSRKLNPECAHVEGDMRTVRLDRTFDCVFVHDAIVYMLTEADLRAALTTAWLHCAEGGAALFAPDHLRETFVPSTECGGHDGDGRSIRYLEWTWDPDPADTTYVVDYAYLLRAADGSVSVEHDRHIEGIFGQEQWLRLLAEVGFEARMVPFDHSTLEPGTNFLFVARRPHTHQRRR